MYNILVLYTKLYLEYYFRLLYIIWKFYILIILLIYYSQRQISKKDYKKKNFWNCDGKEFLKNVVSCKIVVE